MKFLTQGFTRGFFRNSDARPVELKITKFPDTRGRRTGSQPLFDCLVQMNDVCLHSARPQTKEWLLEEAAHMGRQMAIAKARCDATTARAQLTGFLNEENNYGQ